MDNMFRTKPDSDEAKDSAEKLLRSVIDSFPFPFYIIDVNDYSLKLANACARSLMDKKQTTCYALTHGRNTPCDGIDHVCPLQEVRRTKKPIIVEHTHIDCEGKEKTYEIHAYPILDEEGNVSQMIEASLDISEKKIIESKLRRNSEMTDTLNILLHDSIKTRSFDEFLSNSLDLLLSIKWLALESKGAIFLTDTKSDVLVMKAQRNLASALLIKCSKVNFGQCLCGMAAQSGKIVFKNHLDEDHTTTFEGISEHGHYCIPIMFEKEALGVINTYVKPGHEFKKEEEDFLLAFADIIAGAIKRKRIELKLETSEEKYRLIFDTAANLIMSVDKDGIIVDCNEQVKPMLGYEKEEFIGKNITSVLPQAQHEKVHQALADIISGSRTKGNEYRFITKNGLFLDVRISSSAMKDDSGNFLRTVSIVEDVSSEKMAEYALKEEKRELEDLNTLMIDRELKMIELKQEINSILEKNGEKKKYDI